LPLSIDFGGVRTSRPFPVTGGVPLARGVLQNADRVGLSIDGHEVPLQTEVTAVWPDGSVKWLLLDFPTTAGPHDVKLLFGDDVRPQSPPKGITAAETEQGVTVDTGRVRFSVDRHGSGFLDELVFDGRVVHDAGGRRVNFCDFIHAENPGDYPPMQRYVRGGKLDPSKLVVDGVVLEKAGPLRTVVRVDGRYTYQHVGSTIEGTDVKGDCPFRLRIHAYAGQPLLKIEHFFYYEGDGDHDFIRSLGLSLNMPQGIDRVRYLGDDVFPSQQPISGLYQQDADNFTLWQSTGGSATVSATGRRFDGVLDVGLDVVPDEAIGEPDHAVGVAVGVKDFWRSAAKSLHADQSAGRVSLNLWPPEAPPLDFRRHAREWSVGETGTPDDPQGTRPAPLTRPNYRLASKGVGRTHYAMIYPHAGDVDDAELRAVYRLFCHRPLVWASPRHYASTRALGPYRERVPGEHEDVERVLTSAIDVWKSSQEKCRWYGFWLHGNVCQDIHGFIQNGRWCREFGRWGFAGGDSVGRLAHALMLQTLRECSRENFEFGEAYLYNVHDVWATHTPAYPHHYGGFQYLKGACHRHGAWPWACLYVGARGAHPVGAKIYYFLTGEGRAKDVLEEITQLALKNPNGGEGDGPLGPNAQIFLYQWETTGDVRWRDRLKAEIDTSELLRTADDGWLCMMSAAFGIKNALNEYMDLSGDYRQRALAADFADRSMPATMKRHWTWGGYFRVYSAAYNLTGQAKYRAAIEEMLEVLVEKAQPSLALRVPPSEWPGPPGGPRPLIDANIIRDVPYALYSLHADEKEE